MKFSSAQLLRIKAAVSKAFLTITSACLALVTAVSFFRSFPEHAEDLEFILTSPLVTQVWEFRYELALLLIAVICFVTLKVINRLQREISRLRKIPGLSQSAAGLHHQLLAWIYDKKLAARISPPNASDVEAAEKYVTESLVTSCTYASEELTALTGRRCHTCIKTLDPTDGKVTVKARDATTGGRRQHANQLDYLYSDNTAFRRIVDGGMREFLENDLVALRKQDDIGYDNVSNDWTDHYDATFVIPIYRKGQDVPNGRKAIWGFFCADNKGGGFDRHACGEVMTRYARTHQRIIEEIESYKTLGSADPIEGKKGPRGQSDASGTT